MIYPQIEALTKMLPHPPYQHQVEAVKLARTMPNRALFWEMGTGKTAGTILILRDKYAAHKRVLRTLVIGPLAVVYNWKKEIAKYSKIDANLILVPEGTGAKKAQQIMQHTVAPDNTYTRGCIVIVNYDALLNDALFDKLKAWGPEVIVCDESHLLKNNAAERSKRTMKLADCAQFKLILTGTPIANSPIDAFMQYRILDGGETFGKNKKAFVDKYFQDKNAGWASKQGYFPDIVPRQSMYSELNAKIYSKATRILKNECMDLPDRIEQTEYVELSETQRKAYNEMKRDFITYVENLKTSAEPKAIVANLAITKALRMMQIVCGHANTEDGTCIDFGDIPRLKRTRELLEELTPNHKVIVWTCFKHDVEKLSQLCTDLGIKFATITGELNAKEKQAQVDYFETNPECRVVIANRKAGGTGINLVAASYSIVYSKNHSLIDEMQSRDRNHRGGSQIHSKIVKIDLCARGTIDEVITESLKNKEDLANLILTMDTKRF